MSGKHYRPRWRVERHHTSAGAGHGWWAYESSDPESWEYCPSFESHADAIAYADRKARQQAARLAVAA